MGGKQQHTNISSAKLTKQRYLLSVCGLWSVVCGWYFGGLCVNNRL
jgi:hypothetical protein